MARRKRYPTQTITYADYADDITLMANTPAQAESLLHSLEQVAGGIGKIEFMCFNQSGYISTLNSRSLKLVDTFIYLRSSVSSTENDVNTRIAKAETTIDRVLVRWKLDLSDRRKLIFSKWWSCQYYYIEALHGRFLNVRRKNLKAIAKEYFEMY